MLTQERLKELLHYDPDTGLFTRLVTVAAFGAQKGKIAGNVDKKFGYCLIRIDGRGYLAHRLAFLYMTDSIPEEVDHRDLNRSNNKWINLRAARHVDNMRNQPI